MSNLNVTGFKPIVSTNNPDTDLRNFAKTNRLSLEQAEKILQSAFGNPPKTTKTNQESADTPVKITTQTQQNKQPKTLTVKGYKSIPSTGNPETDAKNFAKTNKISIEQAKKLLAATYGNPQTSSSKSLDILS